MKIKLTLLIIFLFSGINGFAQNCSELKINGNVTCFVSNIPIELFVGDTLDFRFNYIINNQDSLSITSDFTSVFPGATFTEITPVPNQYFHKIVEIRWIPTLADASLNPGMGLIKISDNAKPVTHTQTMGYLIRVNLPGSITKNSQPVNITEEINLQPGILFNFRLSSINPASSDSVSITSNINTVIPAATFSTNTAKQQTSEISWTPTTADVSATPYVFTLTLRDNSTPAGKQYVYTVKLRVGNVMALKKEISSISFSAFPNPFTDQVTFCIDQIKAVDNIVIYNLLGQQVDQIRLQKTVADKQQVSWKNSGNFSNGTYLARLISEGKAVQTLKFVKQ